MKRLGSAATDAPPIISGARVLVHGLVMRTDLNGRFGIVSGDELPGGRYELRLEETGNRVSVKAYNFTRVVTKVTSCVQIADDGHAFDPASLMRGDCVLCLGERRATRALVPCGHLAVCSDCAPDIRMQGRCPICRHFVSDLIRVFIPGGNAQLAEAKEKGSRKEKKTKKPKKEKKAKQTTSL
jgi:hypothetical protein